MHRFKCVFYETLLYPKTIFTITETFIATMMGASCGSKLRPTGGGLSRLAVTNGMPGGPLALPPSMLVGRANPPLPCLTVGLASEANSWHLGPGLVYI